MIYLVLIASALVRYYNNTAIALWHDEAFSALYLRYSWGEMIDRIILDVHPPLYYFVLRVWSYVFGDGLLALRAMSILFGVLTVWAGYMFVKTAFRNPRLGLIAALLLAINPFQIQYALEARMYTLGTFLALLSSYFLTRALDGSASGLRSKRYWWYYALAVAAALYTHYFLLFTVAAQGVFVLFYLIHSRRFSVLIWSALSYAVGFALYVPWLPSLWKQIRQVQENYWIPPIDRWSVPGTIWKMVFGGTGINQRILMISSAVAILFVLYYIKKVRGIHKWHIWLGVLIPIAGSVLMSLNTDIYLDRYFVFASLYFSILIITLFYYFRSFLVRYILIFLLLGSSGFAFWKNWQELDVHGKPGMAAAAEVINSQAEPSDQIISGSSFIYFTFKYYNQTGIAPLLISDRPIKDIPHFSGTAILTDDDLILDLGQYQSGQRVWVLWTTGFGGNKPGLPENWQQINDTSFTDAPGFKGDIFVSEYQVN